MSEIPKELSEVAMGDMADMLTSFYKRLLGNGLSEQVAMTFTQTFLANIIAMIGKRQV